MTTTRWVRHLGGLLLIALLLATTGCNTMEGLGKDIGALGDAISNEANGEGEAD